MPNLILSVESVSKSFGGEVALRQVSFGAVMGEVLGILGPSGSGKSALMRMLGGMVMPDSGDIIVGGTSLYRDYEKCMSMIGYVPEEPVFYDYMTCMDNLRAFADMYGGIKQSQIDDIVVHMGLADYAYRKVSMCSYGVKCRLALASAMVNSPRLLVMGNLLDGLDPLAIVDLRRELKRMAAERGLTIIMTSRLINELERMCDRVMILDEGRMVGIGTVEKLKQASTGKLRHKLLLDQPEAAAVYLHDTIGVPTELRGDVVIIDAEQAMIPKIISMLYARGNLVYEISPIELTLEEAYYHLLRARNKKQGMVNAAVVEGYGL